MTPVPQKVQQIEEPSKIQELRAFVLRRFRVPLDLLWIVGWRDLFLASGFACVIRGIALFSIALAWIAAGVGLMAFGFLMSEPATPPVVKKRLN